MEELEQDVATINLIQSTSYDKTRADRWTWKRAPSRLFSSASVVTMISNEPEEEDHSD